MTVGPKVSIVVQRATSTSDNMGGFTNSWATLATLSGTFLSLQGRENFSDDSTKVVSTHFFQCKYPTSVTITEKDRVSYNGSYYQISFLDNLAEKNITLIIYLKKVE